MSDTKISAMTAASNLTNMVLAGEALGVNLSYPVALFNTAYQASSANLTSWAAITRGTGFDTFVATPSSANLLALITDETGTGAAVFGTTPTFTTNITTPKVIGGTGVGSSLSLQSTSGVGSSDFINFLVGSAGGTEVARYLTGGQYVIGGTSAFVTRVGVTNVTPQSQILANGSAASFIMARFSADANGGRILFAKSRNTTVGSHTIASVSDSMGEFVWGASNGSDISEGARIVSTVDTAPGATFTKSSITIRTSDGSNTPSDRFTVNGDGFSQVLNGSFGRGAPVTKTADFTVATTENWLINNKAAATCTVTLPTASSFTGREITIKTTQAFTVVSASSNVVPLAGGSAATAILAATIGKWATLVSDGTNWIIMAGN